MNVDDITVITSFSKKLYDDYGRLFLKTWLRHWPASVKVIVVSEDWGESDWERPPNSGHIEIRNLLEISPACTNFLLRHRENWRAHGKKVNEPHPWGKHPRRQKYNFRFDAYKFCRKVFAIQAVAHTCLPGRLYWIDADTYTDLQAIPSHIDGMLPPDRDVSFLGRPGYHSECGFIGYRLPEAIHFIDFFASLYDSDKVFELGQQHDSWVFDRVRETFSHLRYYDHNHSGEKHVRAFEDSPLGDFMIHLKGALKDDPDPEWVVATRRRRVLQDRANRKG